MAERPGRVEGGQTLSGNSEIEGFKSREREKVKARVKRRTGLRRVQGRSEQYTTAQKNAVRRAVDKMKSLQKEDEELQQAI